MKINSTQLLELVVQNRAYILYEKGMPYASNLKKPVATIMGEEGRPLSISNQMGYVNVALQLPLAVFQDWLEARLIEKDRDEGESCVIYRVTSAGKIRGHNRRTALIEMAEYVNENWVSFAQAGLRVLNQEERENKRIAIQSLAVDLETLSRTSPTEPIPYSKFEEVLDKLNAEGFFPPGDQITAVTEAFAKAS